MFRANAVFFEGVTVEFCAVTDMLFETVAGVFSSKFGHIGISGDFSDDGGGGDFGDEPIGFSERRDAAFKRRVFEKIDGTIDDDAGKKGFLGEDLFYGTSSGKFKGGRKTILVEFSSTNPANRIS